MPVTIIPSGSFRAGMIGSGSALASGFETPATLVLRNAPPMTVTKLGQKPLVQEKSLLQDA